MEKGIVVKKGYSGRLISVYGFCNSIEDNLLKSACCVDCYGENRIKELDLRVGDEVIAAQANNHITFSTKDGVVWEGVEEILIEKLKEFLENATLSNDESGKKYNFIKQCKKIGELNAQDEEDDSPEDDSPADDSPIEDIIDDIGGDGEGEIFIAPIDGDDDEIEEEFFDDDSIQTVSLKYENTTWNIKIKTVLKDDEKFYRIIDGPHGSKDDFSRDLGLKINLGHPFFRFHFFQGNQQKEGTIKICIALALAEAISAELTGNQAASVRLRFNEILNTFGESY